MKVKVDNYRGWDISFDTEKENFYAESNEYDREETKKSFAAAKKFIDEFIKENLNFKPVWVEETANACRNAIKVKLIGIRKDGRFVYEDKKGEKQQMSDWSEKDYILCNPDNDVFYRQIADCNARVKLIDEERKEIEAKIIRVGLAELKRKFTV
jgi:hypothetical protein